MGRLVRLSFIDPWSSFSVGADQTIAGPVTAGRKVRTPQGRVLHNVESWKHEGKCNRKQTAPLSVT
ncbi:hypothetical protein JCM14469_08340 [Desulfatiferula olefinivorans]